MIITASILTIQNYLLDLQERLRCMVNNLEQKKSMQIDVWQQNNINGKTLTIANGSTFEKGGIGFSIINSDKLPPTASKRHPELAGEPFTALGVSVVLHPTNPFAPTSHLNVRFFIGYPKNGHPVWWFGGGYDLTPYYLFTEDAVLWHRAASNACSVLDQHCYPQFKTWCDQYFYLPHRQETRGIGGIFYDDLSAPDFDTCFKFMQSVGDSYLESYNAILERRIDTPYTKQQKDFQLVRRGRYVEFNLLYDRGTLFGLQSGGRTESILMSLPPVVNWTYKHQIQEDSLEEKLLQVLQQPVDWLNLTPEELKNLDSIMELVI